MSDEIDLHADALSEALENILTSVIGVCGADRRTASP